MSIILSILPSNPLGSDQLCDAAGEVRLEQTLVDQLPH